MVIGIIGGIASGKSAVAQMCRRLGAEVIEADKIGHEVLNEPAVLAELARRWGARIIQADGTADRAAIASMVFALSPEGAEERRFLESVTHPRIAARVREELDRCRERGTTVVVLDAPVLLEAGWESLCDRLWFVEVDRAERVRRALARGWTETQFTAREASQWPVSQKRKLADQVIDNSGSFEHTFAQLQHFWHSLNPLPPE